MSFISGAYFEVALFGAGVGLMGNFLSVTGLDMEFEYEVYCEGGSRYPRYFYKQRASALHAPAKQGHLTIHK